MTAPFSESPKEQALQLLDLLRGALETDNLNSATRQLETLKDLLDDWHDQIRVDEAREYLDAAFADDVLTFNVDVAQQQLDSWRQAAGDSDPDHAQYQAKVEQYIQQRDKALKVRGVLAFCEELLRRAKQEETSNEPQDPEFIYKQYYRKARGIALAASIENNDDDSLAEMVDRTNMLYEQAGLALKIFQKALEEREYTEALDCLDQLPDDMAIPRYTAKREDGEFKLHFVTMVSSSEARKEINKLALHYATEIAQKAVLAARPLFDKHQPHEALEVLNIPESLLQFLEDDVKTLHAELLERANADSANYDRAQVYAQRAIEIADRAPLDAWDEYARAYHTYRHADGVNTAREAALVSLRKQLDALIQRAENAFQAHQMNRVEQLYAEAQQLYGGKDGSLDRMLQNLTEIYEMVGRYQDYLNRARDTLEQIKDLLWTDTAACDELLLKIEGYPDIVQEALPEVAELRRLVNHRLNADHAYSQLHQLLFSDDADGIRDGIAAAGDHSSTYRDDSRFPALQQSLQQHLVFLQARSLATNGRIAEALDRLEPLLNMPRHPDYESALNLASQLRPTDNGNAASGAGVRD